jgi:hypothetical protein
MNDYTVTLVYDLLNITTVIYADNEEEAKRYAIQKLDEHAINLGEPMEYQIELEGSFANA